MVQPNGARITAAGLLIGVAIVLSSCLFGPGDQSVQTFNGARWVSTMAFSADGEELIAFDRKSSALAAWPIRSDAKDVTPTLFKGKVDTPRFLAMSPDGNEVVAVSEKEISRWNIRDRELISTVKLGTRLESVKTVASTPDGHIVMLGTTKVLAQTKDFAVRYGRVEVLDGRTGASQHVFKTSWSSEPKLAVSPDGRLAVVGANDPLRFDGKSAFEGTTLIDMARRKIVRRYRDPKRMGLTAFSPNGEMFAVAGYQDIIVRDARTGRDIISLSQFDKLTKYVTAMAFSTDNRWLASAGSGGVIQIWDIEKDKLVKTLVGHEENITALVFSSTVGVLASASYDRTIKIWEVAE